MIIDSGRYKITEVLYSQPGFEAALCCDVTVNSGEIFIVDEYSSKAYIGELLPLFYDLKKNRFKGLCKLVTSSGSFSAVFPYHPGEAFLEYFSRPSRDHEGNIRLADSMLCEALEFDLADDHTAAGCLTPENAVVDAPQGRVYFNMLLYPDVVSSGSFRTIRLGQMLDKMFRRDRYFPEIIGDFIDEMMAGRYQSCAAAYSAWRGIREEAEKTRAAYLKETLFAYLGRKIRRKKLKLSRKQTNA